MRRVQRLLPEPADRQPSGRTQPVDCRLLAMPRRLAMAFPGRTGMLGAIDLCEGFATTLREVLNSRADGGHSDNFPFSRRRLLIDSPIELFVLQTFFTLQAAEIVLQKWRCFPVTWDGIVIWF